MCVVANQPNLKCGQTQLLGQYRDQQGVMSRINDSAGITTGHSTLCGRLVVHSWKQTAAGRMWTDARELC